MSTTLSLVSSVKLSSGHYMPLLGLGVFENADCSPAVLAALKHGYRHIDSARMYKNEEEVGKAIRESGVPREEIFVTSKIFPSEHGYESTLKAVDSSLERFGFDYIDLFMIHAPLSGKDKRVATWKALVESKKAGKLRTIGVSNYGVRHLEEIREAGLETPSVNQIELHPLCQQKDIVDYCSKNGIFIQAYCPLMRGQFNNPVFQEVAKKYNKNIPQVLIRWSLQRGFSPLPKSSKPERVASNADVYDFDLAEEDMDRINALDRGSNGAIFWNPVDADSQVGMVMGVIGRSVSNAFNAILHPFGGR